MRKPTNVTVAPANRLGLHYADEAARLGTPPGGIIDVHTHLRGCSAIATYRDVARRFGITQTWSMTPLKQIPQVREVLGDTVRFIAQPDFRSDDPLHAMGRGFLADIAAFHNEGARLVKFWAAPRAGDLARDAGEPRLMSLDGPHRRAQMELATDLGMGIMTHVGDPDTWFATRYADAALYGTKRSQYEAFEIALNTFEVPWIAAHFGGWPEDLVFLNGLLERHANLHLDTSATKWMVRELSRHTREDLLDFLERWSGRILFGSDIVVQDEHLETHDGSTQHVFDLYASRYWALRTLFETEYNGPSPIADPDLAMVDPLRYVPHDAPTLRGCNLPPDVLQQMYRGAAERFMNDVDGTDQR
ncbi:MAG: amidohydrolase family protein [Phycisphaerales bacterium]|jgi:hypothetical protein|nr:amidohydrolase family protein [Phycisphaerales bacterium]